MKEQNNPVLSRYIAAAQHYETLDRETERSLVEAWQGTKDTQASERLIRANLRHVVAIALKYRRYGVPLSELIAEGNFGLMHALNKFDPKLGHRFVTYAAYWVRAYVLGYVLRTWSLVGGGSGALRSKVFFRLRRERVRLMNLTGDAQETERLLAERLKVPHSALQAMLQRLESRDLSLDLKVFDDSASTLADRMVSPGATSEDITLHKELVRKLKGDVREAITKLDTRERYIVERRLLADPEDELSLAEIGRQLGVSRERARQLEDRAKTKLRHELGGRDSVLGLTVAAAEGELPVRRCA